MRRELVAELLELSPSERHDLIGTLWDSLDVKELPPLTDEQTKELDRRLAEHRANPSRAIPWEQVMTELRARFG
jgi:putative addiction module component (TIGR02574 family)